MTLLALESKEHEGCLCGQRGDANVDKGDGSGLSCMLEGAGSWQESRAGAWTGREQAREQPGRRNK